MENNYELYFYYCYYKLCFSIIWLLMEVCYLCLRRCDLFFWFGLWCACWFFLRNWFWMGINLLLCCWLKLLYVSWWWRSVFVDCFECRRCESVKIRRTFVKCCRKFWIYEWCWCKFCLCVLKYLMCCLWWCYWGCVLWVLVLGMGGVLKMRAVRLWWRLICEFYFWKVCEVVWWVWNWVFWVSCWCCGVIWLCVSVFDCCLGVDMIWWYLGIAFFVLKTSGVRSCVF